MHKIELHGNEANRTMILLFTQVNIYIFSYTFKKKVTFTVTLVPVCKRIAKLDLNDSAFFSKHTVQLKTHRVLLLFLSEMRPQVSGL